MVKAVVPKNNVSLIGMAACGKSTIGVLLAKSLNMMFVDTDLIIQQKHGKSLQQILDAEGIAAFKQKEADVISSLTCDQTCIATGGSAVYSERAMKRLKEISAVVFIDVPYAVIERRIQDIKSRGVVMEQGRTLFDLYHERRPLYETYADVMIAAENLQMEEIVTKIIRQI